MILFVLVLLFPSLVLVPLFYAVVFCVEFCVKHPWAIFRAFLWCFLPLVIIGGCLTALEFALGPNGTAIVMLALIVVGCWRVNIWLRKEAILTKEKKRLAKEARKMRRLAKIRFTPRQSHVL